MAHLMRNATDLPAQTSPGSRRDWLRPPRHLALTTPGKFFLLMTLAIGFGAINTGNNLLFLLLGMMLSLIVASGLLSEAVLRTLRVRRELPVRIFANEPAAGRFILENKGRWPSLSVEVAEHSPHVVAGPQRGRSLAAPRHSWWKFWRTQTSDEERPLAAAYCLRADAAQQTALATHYELPARGAYLLPGVQISTRFPFGFFEKSRELDQAQRVIVYPRSRPTSTRIAEIHQHLGDMSQSRAGRGDDFFGLRDYRDGEDQRAIHWKSTARRAAPVVRELESNDRRDVRIVLDNRATSGVPTPGERQTFERGIEHIAGLIEALVASGYRAELVCAHLPGADEADAPAHNLDTMLTRLALVELLPASAGQPQPPSSATGGSSPALVRIGFTAAHAPEGAVSLAFDDLIAADISQQERA
ncbi:DUF58 domain-containing protein [Lujinxingia vulgaris]|uniref:DUF58 domain-containing protein n=1 Tax=Lujinxingia vulgaris TaxID=2600176 RepID=A0A5C6XDQ6_9DELT|nr:DUF58 domain-containing protein [Lujinxingia vulgaris]TXD38598.1 DUF58 domain-containing protein [Lujinxingia vulgaris]